MTSSITPVVVRMAALGLRTLSLGALSLGAVLLACSASASAQAPVQSDASTVSGAAYRQEAAAPSPDTSPFASLDVLTLREIEGGAWSEIGGGIALILGGIALGASAIPVGLESQVYGTHCGSSWGFSREVCTSEVVGHDAGLLGVTLGMAAAGLTAILVGGLRVIHPARRRIRGVRLELESREPMVTGSLSFAGGAEGASMALRLDF